MNSHVMANQPYNNPTRSLAMMQEHQRDAVLSRVREIMMSELDANELIQTTYVAPVPSVKLDSLYKPILRRFRAYFRSKFDLLHNPNTYQHWTNEGYIHKVRVFCTEQLKLPEAIMDHQSIVKVVTILFPCTLRKDMGACPFNTRSFFVQVFKENNVKIRNRFFSDPLVKYLWAKVFILEASEICISHLRRIRSHQEHGEAKYERIMKDLKHNETQFNLKMVPDFARD